MKKYLVSLASDSASRAVVSRAIADCAADGATLVAVFVARPSETIGVSRRLMESSMLGSAQSRETATEIKRSTLKLGYDRLEEIASLAESCNVPCETNLINGSFDEQTLNVARMGGITRIYISGDNRNVLSRLFLKSEVDSVADGAACQVLVVDE